MEAEQEREMRWSVLPRLSSPSALLPGSGVEPLVLQVLVERGDIFAIAVEEERRHPLVAAEHPLIGLAPARMRHGRVHIGPEAVLGGLDRLPEIVGLLVGEA